MPEKRNGFKWGFYVESIQTDAIVEQKRGKKSHIQQKEVSD